MLEINLVPEQLRKKRKKSTAGSSTISLLPKETFIGISALFIIICVVLVVILQSIILAKVNQQRILEKKMTEIAALKDGVNRLVTQLKETKEKLAPLEKIIGKNDIRWSEKLNAVSDVLPRGVWLNRLALEGEIFLINGSAVSKGKAEMIEVHTFTANLKNNKAFMKDFHDIEPELIKSRLIGDTSTAVFTLKVDMAQTE